MARLLQLPGQRNIQPRPKVIEPSRVEAYRTSVRCRPACASRAPLPSNPPYGEPKRAVVAGVGADAGPIGARCGRRPESHARHPPEMSYHPPEVCFSRHDCYAPEALSVGRPAIEGASVL